jgi:small subunit ribosomal protein S1
MEENNNFNEQANSQEEDFASLLDSFERSRGEMKAGQIAQGKIVSIFDTEVLVDVGGRSEGVMPREEITTADGSLLFQVGETIPVMLGGNLIRDGQLRLSFARANRALKEEALREAVESGQPLEGKVVEVIKGGFLVDVGTRAFVPVSQMDDQLVADPKVYLGQTYSFRVTQHDLPNGKLVLSRRAILQEENARRRQALLDGLADGQRREGTVKRVQDFGVFVDLGGVEGLLHVSEMSWRRLKHPSELFQVGDRIEVVVLRFERGKGKISLGYRKEADDPWLKAADLYKEGTQIKGTIQKLENFGAFIELESGIQGLIPISEMSWTRRISHPKQVLNVGDVVEAVVMRLDPAGRKMSLSLKQISEHPWETFSRSNRSGSLLKGKVTKVSDFGLFVELADGVEGLVHISEVAEIASKSVLDGFKEGQEITVKILSLDPAAKKISLSIKAIAADEAQKSIDDYLQRNISPGGQTLGDLFPEDLRKKFMKS